MKLLSHSDSILHNTAKSIRYWTAANDRATTVGYTDPIWRDGQTPMHCLFAVVYQNEAFEQDHLYLKSSLLVKANLETKR